jgi:hypothetical protein
MAEDFRLRPLHRQRRSRRRTVQVLNQAELAECFGVPHDQVRDALLAAGWQFHEDSTGALWATPQEPPHAME